MLFSRGLCEVVESHQRAMAATVGIEADHRRRSRRRKERAPNVERKTHSSSHVFECPKASPAARHRSRTVDKSTRTRCERIRQWFCGRRSNTVPPPAVDEASTSTTRHTRTSSGPRVSFNMDDDDGDDRTSRCLECEWHAARANDETFEDSYTAFKRRRQAELGRQSIDNQSRCRRSKSTSEAPTFIGQ